MRIGLVSCSSEKCDAPCPARELYTSSLFRMSLKLAEHGCDRVFVISAVHGIVELDQQLAPYNMTLARMSVAARVLWGHRCIIQLVAHVGADRDHQLKMFAGNLYVAPIEQACRPLRWLVTDPMRGLQIGERLSYLSQQVRTIGA